MTEYCFKGSTRYKRKIQPRTEKPISILDCCKDVRVHVNT